MSWAEHWAGQTVASSAVLLVAQSVERLVEQSVGWMVVTTVARSAGW